MQGLKSQGIFRNFSAYDTGALASVVFHDDSGSTLAGFVSCMKLEGSQTQRAGASPRLCGFRIESSHLWLD